MRICADFDLLAVVSGNRRTIRLIPMSSAISGTYEQEPPKLEETRGCSHFAMGEFFIVENREVVFF